jgi:tetratricopeptide (TPR) repeat protein
MSSPKRKLLTSFPIYLVFFSSVCIAGEEMWIEIKSPNFTVISNASPKQARQTAKAFEQFRLLVQTVWPKIKVDPSAPLVIFAGKDEKSYKSLIGEDHQEKGDRQTAGLFIAGSETQFVALCLDNPGGKPYHVIYHEYIHMITRLNFGSLPLWLSEGLAELFANADLSDKFQGIGKFNPESAQILKDNTPLPLPVLMSATHDSPYYRQKDKAKIFYAQSWALAHYLYLGDKRAHQAQLVSYIQMIVDGTPEQEAASRAFGDLKALGKALVNYLSATTYYLGGKAPLKINEDQYEARSLSPAESLALRGTLLVHVNKLEQAKTALEQSLELDPRSAHANEGMGYLFWRLKDNEHARKYFSAAAELDSKNCLAQYFAAEAAMSQDEDFDAAEKYYRNAVAINPQFAPAYGQLSQLLLRTKTNLNEALEYANKGAALEPGQIRYKLNIASVLAAMGKIDEAFALAQRMLAAAQEENDRRQVESFMNWISSLLDQRDHTPSPQRIKAERSRPSIEDQQWDPKAEEEKFNAFNEAEKKRKAEAARLASLKTGPAVKLRGIARSVQCDSPAIMDVVLEANGKLQRLHVENYFDVRYSSIGASTKAKLEPCKDLEGKMLEVEYLTVDGEIISGFIQSIGVMSNSQ